MMRRPARARTPGKNSIDNSLSLPAPYRGLNARDPEALMQESFALSMINCFPSAADVQLRAGASDHTTGFSTHVKGLFSYNPAVGGPRQFASTDAGIFAATVGGAVGANLLVHSSGWARGLNYRTIGGSFLLLVNGSDNLAKYDGTTWSTVANFSIVGGGTLLTRDIVHLTAFKRRIFFVEGNTLDAYSLPLDSIAGTVDRIPLGGLFQKGGFLVAVATWTLDGGKGQDDRIVFFSSMGQAAVYAGTDPTDPNNWGLVGVYDLAEPLGNDCVIKYGGDMLYLSKSGVYPFSLALQSKTVATAITDTIRTAFARAALLYGRNHGWCMAIDEPNSLLIVNVPITTLGYSKQFVMNLITGAWTTFQDWNSYTYNYFDGQLYMGMADKVAKAYSGLNDFGSVITGQTKQAFTYLGQRGVSKQIQLLRPVLKLAGSVSVEMAVDMDFRNDATFGPTAFGVGAGAVWAAAGDLDPALWDSAIWGDDSAIRLEWQSPLVEPGYAAAMRLRFTTGAAKVAWTATDVLWTRGGFM